MPTKYGRIASWGRRGRSFVEAYLETGERVELSDAALAALREHDPSQELVFVERRGRIFHYVQWLGTPAEALDALEAGILRPDEVPDDLRVVGTAQRSSTKATTSERARADAESERNLFGPASPHVLSFLDWLGRLDSPTWLALVEAHQTAGQTAGGAYWQGLRTLVEEAGRGGVASGAITVTDVETAKRLAEETADRALPSMVASLLARSNARSREEWERTLGPAMRAAANALLTDVLVMPYLDEAEAARLWAPWAAIARIPR